MWLGYVCLLGALTVVVLAEEKSCANDRTLLAHQNCSRFYVLDKGAVFDLECPQRMHFNKLTQVCDLSDKAGCERKKEADLSSSCSNEGKATPHEDCSKFYACLNGHRVVLNCPKRKHFNVRLGLCDDPNTAGCMGKLTKLLVNAESIPGSQTQIGAHQDDGSNNLPSGVRNSLASKRPAEEETEEDDEGTDDEGTYDEGTEEEETDEEGTDNEEAELSVPNVVVYKTKRNCPKPSDTNATVYMRHHDKNRYYVCRDGKRVMMKCPSEMNFYLRWNSEDSNKFWTCKRKQKKKPKYRDGSKSDILLNGLGEIENSPASKRTVQRETDKGTDDEEIVEVGTDNEEAELSVPVALLYKTKRKCPKPSDRNITVYMRHHKKNKYYVCRDGKRVKKKCPKGMRFHLRWNSKDSNKFLTCQRKKKMKSKYRDGSNSDYLLIGENSTASKRPTQKETGEDKKGTYNDGTELSVPGAVLYKTQNECPTHFDKKTTVYMRHYEKDTYYVCRSGRRVLEKCPSGTHFNLRKTCIDDKAQNHNNANEIFTVCESDSNLQNQVENVPVQKKPVQTTQTQVILVQATPKKTVKRCSGRKKWDPNSCRHFYQCNVRHKCTDGRYYDPFLDICAYYAFIYC